MRWWLYQPTQPETSISTSVRVLQALRWISSSLNVALTDSARALSYESATEPTDAAARISASRSV